MAKETHVVRVWAQRGDRRTLELSLDSPSARNSALDRIAMLKRDASVDGVEMEEYVVLAEDADMAVPARRGTMRWKRSGHGRRRLPNGRRAG